MGSENVLYLELGDLCSGCLLLYPCRLRDDRTIAVVFGGADKATSDTRMATLGASVAEQAAVDAGFAGFDGGHSVEV